MTIRFLLIISLFTSLFYNLTACKNGKAAGNEKTDTDTLKRLAVKIEQKNLVIRAPVINISDTVSIKHLVLFMRDSAANSGRIAKKLGEIYSVKLAAIIKKNGLKVTGPPMAWYRSQKAPYFFEAGLPIDRKLVKLPHGVFLKSIATDSTIVAHFYGPYKLTSEAYPILEDWIKYHKKQIIHPPYEVYIDDPTDKNGKLKDSYKVQTDIVFTWK